MGYVPDGMTPEQWKRHQEEEKKKMARKNFAALGPQSFKSRSLQSFQTDLEKGKADHLLPVMFAKDRIKKGEIKETDVPCKYCGTIIGGRRENDIEYDSYLFLLHCRHAAGR